MEKMYADLKGDINDLKGGLQEGFKQLNNRIDKVEKTITKIENEHGKKLETLFDGYKQNSEQLNRIEQEVSKHEEVILRRIK